MAEFPQFIDVEYPSEKWLEELHNWYILHGAEHSPTTINDLFKLLRCVVSLNTGDYAGEYCNGLEFAQQGDLTGDGNINILDLLAMVQCVLYNNCELAESYQWLSIDERILLNQE